MNKNTKICLNYLVGGTISLILLWSIYGQVTRQLSGINSNTWKLTGPAVWLWLSIALMFLNTSLESYKWYLLTNFVEPVVYTKSLASYLAGIAFSIVTPNRIGEYPGRILYLGRTNTFRYINVSILGIMSQLSTIYFFGLAGLIYYNFSFPSLIAKAGLASCFIVVVILVIIYCRFELWLPLMAKIKWFNRFAVYGKLLYRITTKRQISVLSISLFRFIIFTAQYLFLLRWMNVNVPLAEGFCIAALFFWIMAVIPGVALTELGLRSKISLVLFQAFSTNSIGILAATAGIWMLNLIIPSVIGSIIILRMRWLR